MRNASFHQGENERQWKTKVNGNTDISSIKRVTRECLEVSRFRAFLSGGGGHQVGEVTRLGGVNRQSI